MGICGSNPTPDRRKPRKSPEELAREVARKEFDKEMGELESLQKKQNKTAKKAEKKQQKQRQQKQELFGHDNCDDGGLFATGADAAGAQAQQAARQLNENMQKLNTTADETLEMSRRAQDFNDMADELRKKNKKKSRFGF
jgi:hypothetical protein